MVQARSPQSIIMADDVEFMFTPGSIVGIKTCLDVEMEGEVIAFDYDKRVLMIKSVASNQNGAHNDVQVLNLSFVVDVKVIKEVKKEGNASLAELNIQKIQDRCRKAIAERTELKLAIESGVSPNGLQLYQTLKKTMTSVSWDGSNIIVNKDVVVEPPYKTENCNIQQTGRAASNDSNKSQALKYVQSLVERFWNEFTATSDKVAIGQDKSSAPPPAAATQPGRLTTTNSGPPQVAQQAPSRSPLVEAKPSSPATVSKLQQQSVNNNKNLSQRTTKSSPTSGGQSKGKKK
ncbi:Protein LSM12 -like protein [Halotydeus destructor]|nr:Protein LSM12 -like protein [Halotydeus destructor]